MSSRLVQVTVAPTATLIVAGPKLKLSIFTSVFAAEGWAFAVTLGDPANSSTIAIITAAVKLANHTFLPVIVLFLSRFDVLAYSFLCSDRFLVGPSNE